MLLKESWFWKFILSVGIAVAIALTFTLNSDSSGLAYTPAVEAAIFAVFAVLMLLLAHIPNSFAEMKGARLLDVFSLELERLQR